MARKRSSYFIILLLTYSTSIAQTLSQNEFKFIKHLERIEEWQEGILYINLLHGKGIVNDTTNYYLGRFHYQTKSIDRSVSFFDRVGSQNLSYFNHSRFLGGFQYAYQGKYSQAKEQFLKVESQEQMQLLNHELAGLTLLQRDTSNFSKYSSLFGQNYLLEPYENGLQKHYEGIRSFKSKSPFLAGLYSTLVPGLGRFYIGRPGEGVATLLVTSIFALQSWEGYRKDGSESFRFIFFGSLFSITYLANIVGTTLAVRVRRNEFNDQVNDSILLDMHIPLRLIFK